MPKKVKKPKKNKEDSGSDDEGSVYEVESESEDSTTDTNSDAEMLEEEEEDMQNAQKWPDSLEDYYPPQGEQEYKEKVEALFTLYKDYNDGKRTALTMTKGELVKMADITSHMLRKPKDKKEIDWLSEKILSLVPTRKKKRKGGSTGSVAGDTDSLLSPAPSIDLSLSQSQPQASTSQSILQPPTTNKNEVESISVANSAKKPRNHFSTDEKDGKQLINGFPIHTHPKQFKRLKPGEPTDHQITAGYWLDNNETFM